MSDEAHLSIGPTVPRPASAPPTGFDELDFQQTIRRTHDGGKVFGRYMLRHELGRGGMGIVWLARDELLEVDVALKFLPDLIAHDPEAIADLKRETLRSRDVRHPGVVAVYEFAQDATSAAIVMEYVSGATLSELKSEQPEGCFDVEQITPWIEQLCEVLDYAHSHARVVHRDLKPRNLMLNRDGKLKVTDFGIARSVSDSVTRISMRHQTSGTPPYMSPQQHLGDPSTPADDIYSLGATIYDLLTGKPPFYTGNISVQIQEKVPPAMSARRAELKVGNKGPIPQVWQRLVAACLAKEPGSRPKSASECLNWLKGATVRDPTKKPAAKPGEVVAGLALLLVVSVAGSAIWKFVYSPKPQDQIPPHRIEAPITQAATAALPSATADSTSSLSLQATPTTTPFLTEPFPSPSIATASVVASASASASATPKKPATAKKKTLGDDSLSADKSSKGNNTVRRGIEEQYRRGELTRDQYLNALKHL